ncbi:Alpha/Beta hydrolase protein [Lipomyces orientalis]|uniref:Alpha/Beta hydrolase protein n=1 Tax=Lipomyces orientalis TaxID=1233043 RepID=A0ACC3TDB4_9ASCO
MNDVVTSKDGTTISYLKIGEGPGLVILHGVMESARSHFELAEALSPTFTVYLPDRRGRGLSGAYGHDYSMQKEVEDLDALLTKTASRFVLGVSFGGLIALQASWNLKAIHKAVIFEPPLLIENSISTDWVDRYDKEMAEGKIAAALVTGMLGAQMGPPIFQRMPRRLLNQMTKLGMALERSSDGSDGPLPMKVLAPTLHYDSQVVIEMDGKLETFKAIEIEVLLLGGSKSPSYLKTAVDELEKVIPHVIRVEFDGLNHGATGNKNRRGQPDRVAEAVRSFLT